MFMVGLSPGARVNQKKKKKDLFCYYSNRYRGDPQGDGESKWAKNYVPRLLQTELYV